MPSSFQTGLVIVKQAGYCGSVPQEDWSVAITCSVADQIRWWREHRKLSAQAVADKCSALGLRLSRSTLADLENGRRPHVTVAELLVLAAVLDVAPILLLVPLGRRADVGILPDIAMPARDAVLWLAGELGLHLDSSDKALEWLDWQDPRAIVALYRRHDELADDLSDPDVLLPGAWEPGPDLGGVVEMVETPESRRAARKRLEDDLRSVRRRMRDLELMPPDLPAGLAYIDDRRVR